jgi:hypothetical protein
MPAQEPASRTGISPAERALRSKLTQILAGQGLIRGTLLHRQRRCGNPGCHCAKGPGHPGLYLILSDGKRQRQLYIPKDWHGRVRQWVANHHQVKALIHEISQIHWDHIKRRQG